MTLPSLNTARTVNGETRQVTAVGIGYVGYRVGITYYYCSLEAWYRWLESEILEVEKEAAK